MRFGSFSEMLSYWAGADPDAPQCDPDLWNLGVPVLGICYGMQLINYVFGGRVESAEVGEYGHTELRTEGRNLRSRHRYFQNLHILDFLFFCI